MESFGSWWQGLEVISKIYWLITLPFSLLFVIELVMSFLGAGSDSGGFDATGNLDTTTDLDDGISFQLVTLKNLIAFFTVFGWSGLACIDSHLGLASIITISFISGFLMMVIMASIYYFMGRLAESGNLEINRAIGEKASVYLFIPPKRQGVGKIQIKLQGLRTLDAMTDDDMTIPTGSLVEVVGILTNEILLVKKI
ncbi:MAG TPA: hypothetical protein VMW01_03625 [Williamwhitmania sp.]|nr:hypothetical protein [Williamwhitmania sp.]